MAHIPRLFVEADLVESSDIALDEKQSGYLIRVMRLKSDSIARAFNGRDGEWQCTLTVAGKRASITPLKQLRPQTSVPELTLAFAPIKKDRTQFIVEKATELGVRSIIPVVTQYTQHARIKIDKLKLTAIEAAEQTERMDIPKISEPVALTKALSQLGSDRDIYFCDESGDAVPMQKACEGREIRPVTILIGPEGGFSPEERELIRSRDNVIPVTLGPRILRAETAVVSALTLWQSQVGDWQKQPYLAKSE